MTFLCGLVCRLLETSPINFLLAYLLKEGRGADSSKPSDWVLKDIVSELVVNDITWTKNRSIANVYDGSPKVPPSPSPPLPLSLIPFSSSHPLSSFLFSSAFFHVLVGRDKYQWRFGGKIFRAASETVTYLRSSLCSSS